MQCKQCQKDFEQKHFNQKLCSFHCKVESTREVKKRYKQTEKGIAATARWIKSDRRWLNEKRYRNTPRAKSLAVGRSKRFLSNNPEAQKSKKIRDHLYMSRTQGRLRGWWKKESSHGCRMCGTRKKLSIDHIVSLSAGGNPFDENNLQALCRSCNAHKRNKSRNAVDVIIISRLRGCR